MSAKVKQKQRKLLTGSESAVFLNKTVYISSIEIFICVFQSNSLALVLVAPPSPGYPRGGCWELVLLLNFALLSFSEWVGSEKLLRSWRRGARSIVEGRNGSEGARSGEQQWEVAARLFPLSILAARQALPFNLSDASFPLSITDSFTFPSFHNSTA